MAISNPDIVAGASNTRVTYERRTALFGLLEWWVEVKAEVVGRDIHIRTDNPIDHVFLNGEQVL